MNPQSAQHAPLDNTLHRDLRVAACGAVAGATTHYAPVIADELVHLVLEYPVCLMKDADTGRFGLYALLGFEEGENLYLHRGAWQARYLPLHFRRQPFVTIRTPGAEGDLGCPPRIAIDLNNSRVQMSEGERLYTEDGRETEYLLSARSLLERLTAGARSTQSFIGVLAGYDLIEPLRLDVALTTGTRRSYAGAYGINSDRLQTLPPDTLQRLHTLGYLQASYLLLASLGHIRKLIEMKTQRT
ncbi:SapC family protein [Steroidobacter agaridevorans]|uniref:SapC family protein n=1 Tax=Steroidobacter agaridevorans TaxID=2695856 RepID=A0A829Y7J7_9GAMM|nr:MULTISPECIES: SapC family protein [Steroidobacteraceae]GFE79219.1 SapC family protein [Steroidobacter agaridevorans]GFE87260.1 SapC family protein [Steroidobacter agaridevorans]